MPIREAPIYGRPHHVIRVWQLCEASGSYFLFSLDYRSGDPLNSCDIVFFDSERHLLLDSDGQLWLIPPRRLLLPRLLRPNPRYCRAHVTGEAQARHSSADVKGAV
jgi:hypothetical protein